MIQSSSNTIFNTLSSGKGVLQCYFHSENSKRSDIPRIFKPEEDESSDSTETPQSAEFSQSSDTPSSGSGEGSASSDDSEQTIEPSTESSGQAVKRNIIPTEVFEEGRNKIRANRNHCSQLEFIPNRKEWFKRHRTNKNE